MKGGTVHIVCKVPRDAQNRAVRFGLDPDSISSREINGEDGPVFFDKYVEEVGCPGPAEAICDVSRADGKTQRASQTVEVKGCSGDDDFESFD